MTETAKSLLLVILAVVAAFVLMSGYLWLSRSPVHWAIPASDYAALFASVGVFGLISAKLPWEPATKFAFIVVGVPILGLFLFVFSLCFLSATFGEWL